MSILTPRLGKLIYWQKDGSYRNITLTDRDNQNNLDLDEVNKAGTQMKFDIQMSEKDIQSLPKFDSNIGWETWENIV